MERYSLQEAQDHLRQLLDDARHGKTVLIFDETEQAVQLVPLTTSTKTRQAGSARGLVKMAPDFDGPLPDFNDDMK